MGNCKDCRFWLVGHVQLRANSDDRVNRAFMLLPGDPEGARAVLLEQPKTEEFCRCLGARAFVHGTLDTKPDFGCVLWEAK